MKTPREILFERHQAAESKLDAIREAAVASVRDRRYNWREFWFSLRWHLAGMSAAWLMIVLLNLNVGHPASLASALPRGRIPSAQMILAALRENRRELLQMIQSPDSHDTGLQRLTPPQPRSQRRYENLTA